MADYELLETEELTPNGLVNYQQDKAMIDIQISTARKYPRNLKKAIENAITVVTMDEEIAKSCTYSLQKGKTITGPSVNLARILARKMGNMRAENRVIGYDATHVTCEATCIDLETNYGVRTTIKKSIVGKSGRFSEDLIVITGNAGNAIAFRNAVFAVIDVEIVNKVHNAAKAKITGDLSDETKLIARRNKIFEGFKQQYHSMQLTDEEIAKTVGRSTINHITKDDIVVLLSFENSLASGEMTPESLFRPERSRPVIPTDKSGDRLLSLIKNAKTKDELTKHLQHCNTVELKAEYDKRFKELK